MAIVWSIWVSLGCVLLCGGLCYSLFQTRLFQGALLSSQALSLATLAGFWAGYAYMYQRFVPGFPPVDVSQWWILGLPVLALLAYRPHVLLSIPLSAGYAYLLTEPLRQYEWSLFSSLVFSLLAAVVMGGLPFAVYRGLSIVKASDGSEGEKPRYLWPWVMAITSLGSAGLFLLGSSASLSQQALFLTALQGLIAIAFRFDLREEVSAGLVTVSLWLLFMLWLNMLLFASLSYVALVGLLALFTPWVLRFRCMSRASLGLQFLTVGGASALCLVAAVASVFWFQPQAGVYYSLVDKHFQVSR